MRAFSLTSHITQRDAGTGYVRARFDWDGSQVDPRAAERMIRAVYTDEQIGDLDSATMGRTQIILLAALIIGEQLDAFLADAAKLADQWLA